MDRQRTRRQERHTGRLLVAISGRIRLASFLRPATCRSGLYSGPVLWRDCLHTQSHVDSSATNRNLARNGAGVGKGHRLKGQLVRIQTTADGSLTAEQLEAAFMHAKETGKVLKDEKETLLIRAPFPPHNDAYWKLYRIPQRRRWMSPFSRSRAIREWNALCAVRKAGIPCVLPLASCEIRSNGWRTGSLLITEALSNSKDLRERLVFETATPAERTRWLRAAGQAARYLHDSGFGHFRMQARNLLGREESGQAEIYFLDLPYACAFPRPAADAVRCTDLIDLAGERSGLEDEDARQILQAYATPNDSPLDLQTLRRFPAWRQKFRRISLYLFYINTGHRPSSHIH